MSYNEQEYEAYEKMMHEKYPKIFSRQYGGFAIHKGWWHIIERLCANIQHHIDWKQEQLEKFGRGKGCEQLVVEQIKEKFGGLRFYSQGGDGHTDGLITMAECWAANTCEICGERGTRRMTNGWHYTACDTHTRKEESE